MYEQFFDSFRYVEHDDYVGQCAIQVTVPPYEGVTVLLGRKISIVQPQSANEGLQFDYEVLEKPDHVSIEPSEFEGLLGSILLAILERKFSEIEDVEDPAKPVVVFEEPEGEIEPKKVEYDQSTGETTIHFITCDITGGATGD